MPVGRISESVPVFRYGFGNPSYKRFQPILMQCLTVPDGTAKRKRPKGVKPRRGGGREAGESPAGPGRIYFEPFGSRFQPVSVTET